MTLAWWARRDSNSLSHRRQIYSLLRLSCSGARPREKLGAPWSDRTTVADIPNRRPAIERRELAERPVFETEARRLDLVSNRSQCAYLLARSGLAEGGGIEPLTLRSPWFSGPVASHLAAPSIGTPARTRTANLRVLKARGTSTRLGYRGEIGARGAIRTLTGRALDPLPLPVGIRERCRPRGTRTLTEPGLSRRPLPNWARAAISVAPVGVEPNSSTLRGWRPSR
jgi:hypothetical protein